MSNFQDNFNSVIDYIETHLEQDLDFSHISKIAGISLATFQRIFPLFAGVTLTDYIRKRRLTLAGRDLIQTNLRVTDLALKYNYVSATSFSRAFARFHGLKPSEIRRGSGRLRHFPRFTLELPTSRSELDYDIITLPELTLFGFGVKTDYWHIRQDAPEIYGDLARNYPSLRHPDYGMIVYSDGRSSLEHYEYWVLWKNQVCYAISLTSHYFCNHQSKFELTSRKIPASRWIKLKISSQEAHDIQNVTNNFYSEFLPTCSYQLKPSPN